MRLPVEDSGVPTVPTLPTFPALNYGRHKSDQFKACSFPWVIPIDTLALALEACDNGVWTEVRHAEYVKRTPGDGFSIKRPDGLVYSDIPIECASVFNEEEHSRILEVYTQFFDEVKLKRAKIIIPKSKEARRYISYGNPPQSLFLDDHHGNCREDFHAAKRSLRPKVINAYGTAVKRSLLGGFVFYNTVFPPRHLWLEKAPHLEMTLKLDKEDMATVESYMF